MQRRNFLKAAGATALAVVAAEQMTGCSSPSAKSPRQKTAVDKPKVFM
ncbi:MAG: twin-arginine translocation signal domain-containing protein, partial [Tannerella sp.]|nr:twin-arginine translocation signal domain-containing protein [Tannerella sp.]